MENSNETNWNEELEEEVSVREPRSLVVFSRDWTVETIVRQIDRGNIELNPKFQRRNAWNDEKRSKLIESLLIGVPVPEIVLAEDREKKGSFIVIDGKQRLLSVAGYTNSDKFQFWDSPKLRSLKTLKDLNGKGFDELTEDGKESDIQRELLNADIRCTIISNYADVGVLYDIFYRLNAASVPLSSQELRQVLNRGPFADFIIESTNTIIPLHRVLRLDGPDARLRDAEILLRFIAFTLYGKEYDGNLMPFLDAAMAKINKNWDTISRDIETIFNDFNTATNIMLDIFPQNKVGRKFNLTGWESRFNRALYEVQVYYFARCKDTDIASKKDNIVSAFEELCSKNSDFRSSIETSTKNIDRYFTRFSLFQSMINATLGISINDIPVVVERK